MHNNNAREYPRVQCGNAHPVEFSLFDHEKQTAYCICTDLSQTGAHFFTDCEFQVNQRLELVVRINEKQTETLSVTVVRADSSLYDEERFCAAVKFDRPLASYQLLADVVKELAESLAA